MARGIRSVLFAVTPPANAAVGLLMGLFFLCGGPISDWLRNSSRAGGVALVMASPLEGSRERFAMKAVLAMLPGLAWCLAALRGVRSGAPSGPVRCCAYAGVLTAAAAAAVLVRLHGWQSMLSQSSGAIAPVVQISELGYWGTALETALFAAGVAAIWIVWRVPRQERSLAASAAAERTAGSGS